MIRKRSEHRGLRPGGLLRSEVSVPRTMSQELLTPIRLATCLHFVSRNMGLSLEQITSISLRPRQAPPGRWWI
jgi:hypothetical protein